MHRSNIVIGVDEVGRGCLAGPVYAAAVILNEEHPTDMFKDSKSLSHSRRKKISEVIKSDHTGAIGIATVEEISRYNILQASLLAMKRAVYKLGVETGQVLVDGKFVIPQLNESSPNCSHFEQTAIIQGDQKVPAIAAASILAKVARDEALAELSKEYPHYGFEKHKGYATKTHKQAIAQHGPCPHHRPTFAGVKEHL